MTSSLPGPLSLPLLGAALQFDIANPHKTLLQLAQAHGPVVHISFGVLKTPMILVSDPAAVAAILAADNTDYFKGDGYSAVTSVTPEHILVQEGAKWRAYHAVAVAALKPAPQQHRLVLDRAEQLAGALCELCRQQPTAAAGAAGAVVVPNLNEVVRSLSLDIVLDLVLAGRVAALSDPAASDPNLAPSAPLCAAMLAAGVHRASTSTSFFARVSNSGSNSNSTSNGKPAFASWLRAIMEEWHHRIVALVPTWKLTGSLTIPRVREVLRSRANVHKVLHAAVDAALPPAAKAGAGDQDGPDLPPRGTPARPPGLLQEIVRLAHSSGSSARMAEAGLPPDTVAEAVAFSIIAMGHENISSHLTWALYMLAVHPGVQERVYEEVAGAVEAGADVGVWGRPRALPYLEAVLKEALRLYPSVPMLSRRNQRAVTVLGHHIPAESEIVVSPYVQHRLPASWPDPETFNPDRFLPNPSTTTTPSAQEGATSPPPPPEAAQPPPGTYLPFGRGPRACIGAAFAAMQSRLVVAVLVRQFKLSLPSGAAPRQNLFVSLRPQDCKVVFTPR